MSHYYRQQNLHGQNRRGRRYITLAKWFMALIIIAGAVVAADAWRSNRQSSKPTSYTAPLTSTVVADEKPLTSQYFQFQAPNSWRAIANETRGSHFVYRSYNATLLEQELVVDVNDNEPEVLSLVQTARVLPAIINEGIRLTTDGLLSDHCQKGIKPGTPRSPLRLTLNEVSFVCNPDSATYQVAVGVVGGSTDIVLKRPSGETVKYTITYRNLTATPNVRDLISIVNTFQSR